jgi:hypothetical protein
VTTVERFRPWHVSFTLDDDRATLGALALELRPAGADDHVKVLRVVAQAVERGIRVVQVRSFRKVVLVMAHITTPRSGLITGGVRVRQRGRGHCAIRPSVRFTAATGFTAVRFLRVGGRILLAPVGSERTAGIDHRHRAFVAGIRDAVRPR